MPAEAAKIARKKEKLLRNGDELLGFNMRSKSTLYFQLMFLPHFALEA